jgi:hypothetical protein
MKVEIMTMDRKTIVTDVENYDPVAINDQLNEQESRTIVIGSAIVDRNNVMRVLPLSSNDAKKK